MRRIFDVCDILVKHAQNYTALVALQGLDDEAVIAAEKEEAAAGTGTFTRVEHLILVVLDVE